MNTRVYGLIILGIIPVILTAQVNWTKHSIDSNFDGARDVFAIDLNGDSHVDVIGAAADDDSIIWWENNGGSPPYFFKHPVAHIAAPYSVYGIDVDGDDDTDFLAAARDDDAIAWWENVGGAFYRHDIDLSNDAAWDVFAIDLDNDNDIDVLAASSAPDKIVWYENNGSQNFTKRDVGTNFNGAHSVYAIDLDGDADVDVLGAAAYGNEIAWWENNGGSPPSWTYHSINQAFMDAQSVFAVDLDDDTNIDIVGAANVDDDIAWWKNTGGSPPAFIKYPVDEAFDGAHSVYAIDVDNDADVDVIGAAFYADEIAWWENSGGVPPSWTKHVVGSNFDGVMSVYAIDVDGDNDVDILGAAQNADEIAWWENGLIGVEENKLDTPMDVVFASPQPNPFKSATTISYQLSKSGRIELAIYDIRGRLVTCLVDACQDPGCYSVRWDAAGQSSGVYFCHLRTETVTAFRKCIVLN